MLDIGSSVDDCRDSVLNSHLPDVCDSSKAQNPLVGEVIADSGVVDVHQNVSLSISPGNTKYYTPLCDDALKPYAGQLFPTLEEAFSFYTNYADKVGFKVRPGTETKSSDPSKTTIWKYLLCSKQGIMPSKSGLSKAKGQQGVLPSNSGLSKAKGKSEVRRKTVSSRCLCIAKLTLRFQGHVGYCVRQFEERHTHMLLSEEEKQFLTNNRQVTGVHQDFIINCMKSNIGPSKAFKLYKNTVGSYANVGATYIDFKNYGRDLNAYLYEYDAQMAIDNLMRRKDRCAAFYFDYALNENNQLSMLFYSDPISRKSFSFFGDVVSADATYKSNRYGMVFVPFTGVDNHKRSITFGFGLLLKEDIASYSWLFENFKKAMGHEPYVVLSDQDPAVKVAIQNVFPKSVHRFCMWHIMFKVAAKIKLDASVLEEFRKRFNSIVWSDDLMPDQFEQSWQSLLVDFHLESHSWLKSLFDLRHFWVPAYFKDVNMGGLMRTTSRSESQNFFFSSFIGSQSCLNVFILQFDNAIESQRHYQRKNDLDSVSCVPTLKTPLPVEEQCSSLFTINKFYDVQEEILASVFHCSVSDLVKVDHEIQLFHVRSADGKLSVVRHVIGSDDLDCSCNKFLAIGIPCRHLFVVLRSLGKELLPSKFIKARWTKKSILKQTFELDGSVFKESVELDEKKVLAFEILSETHSCINAIDDNVELMKDFLGFLKEKKDLYMSSTGRNASTDAEKKQKRFESFLGPRPTQVDVLPPPQAKTKGRPTMKRLKSSYERGITSSSKEKRLCGKCFKPGHNCRTCGKDL